MNFWISCIFCEGAFLALGVHLTPPKLPQAALMKVHLGVEPRPTCRRAACGGASGDSRSAPSGQEAHCAAVGRRARLAVALAAAQVRGPLQTPHNGRPTCAVAGPGPAAAAVSVPSPAPWVSVARGRQAAHRERCPGAILDRSLRSPPRPHPGEPARVAPGARRPSGGAAVSSRTPASPGASSLQSWRLCCGPGGDARPPGPSGWLGSPLRKQSLRVSLKLSMPATRLSSEAPLTHLLNFLPGLFFIHFSLRWTWGTPCSAFVLNISCVKPKVLFWSLLFMITEHALEFCPF